MDKGIRTGIFSFSHFVMDLSCHYYAFYLIKNHFPENTLLIFLAYNFIAFALQCPIGAFCDRFSGKRSVTGSLMLLLAGFILGFFLFPDNIIGCTAGLMICGFANSACHAGGYAAVAELGEKGLVNGGVFIAFGALGVGLGDHLGNKGISATLWIMVIIAATIVLVNLPAINKEEGLDVRDVMAESKPEVLLLILCLIAVFTRSYGGFILPGSFKVLNIPGSVLGFGGKFLGGFMVLLTAKCLKGSKDLPFVNSLYGAAALLISTLLLTALGSDPIASAIGIVLFHSVMPVTLYEVYRMFPGSPGFSLGLTTVLLFLGFLPTCFFFPEAGLKSGLLLIMCILGTASLGASALIHGIRAKKELRP